MPASSSELALLAKSQSLDNRTVALNILVLKVIEQRAALAYKLGQSPFSAIIFTVHFKVFRQMGNTVGEQGYLGFRRASIRVGLSVLSKDFLFFLFV